MEMTVVLKMPDVRLRPILACPAPREECPSPQQPHPPEWHGFLAKFLRETADVLGRGWLPPGCGPSDKGRTGAKGAEMSGC